MNIDLTDREVELLMTALGARIGTLEQHPDAGNPQLGELITELFELETDLREALHRQDDGWNVAVDAEINETPDAETQMFNAGVKAREQMKERNRLMFTLESQGGRGVELAEQIDQLDAEMKATSRAAGRRAHALNFRFPNVVTPDDDDRSEVQKHDVFDCEWNPDDPKNW